MEGKQQRYSEKRKGYCPEQIPMCINNIQVRKYCRQLYATKNYTGLKELNDCFAIVRRAIMRRYRDEEAHIDESIIRAIERIPVTDEEINASSVYAVARMPVTTNYFDSDIWTIIFREMLPVDEKIEFTHNVFTILLAIFITVTIAEVSLLRKKLTALRNRDRAKGIDDLKRSTPVYSGPYAMEIQDLIGEAVESVMLQGISPEKAVAQLRASVSYLFI